MTAPQIEPISAELAAVRDAAIGSAHGECDAPKGLDHLFEWLFWNSNSTEFDCPYFRIGSLDLTDLDARDVLEIGADEAISDDQRLEYARRRIDRVWNGDELYFAHAYRIERSDGKSTYLCGESYGVGQGGSETFYSGTFPSEEAYLCWLELGGMSNESAETISIDTVLKHWQR